MLMSKDQLNVMVLQLQVEEPFGADYNDLPLDELVADTCNIAIEMAEMAGQQLLVLSEQQQQQQQAGWQGREHGNEAVGSTGAGNGTVISFARSSKQADEDDLV